MMKRENSDRGVMPDFNEHVGEFIDEQCPECNAKLLGNQKGDKWCSYIPCDWSSNVEISDFSKSLKA